jgi:hypothetical protein
MRVYVDQGVWIRQQTLPFGIYQFFCSVAHDRARIFAFVE